MTQAVLNDKLILTLTEKIESADNKDKIKQYISEVAETCRGLCRKGESLRVLHEYKMMIDTLRQEFNL